MLIEVEQVRKQTDKRTQKWGEAHLLMYMSDKQHDDADRDNSQIYNNCSNVLLLPSLSKRRIAAAQKVNTKYRFVFDVKSIVRFLKSGG